MENWFIGKDGMCYQYAIEEDSGGGLVFDVYSASDKMVGHFVFIKDKHSQTCFSNSSDVSADFRKQGISTAIYKVAAARLPYPLCSDSILYPEAKLLWDGFVEKGWAVKKEKGYQWVAY